MRYSAFLFEGARVTCYGSQAKLSCLRLRTTGQQGMLFIKLAQYLSQVHRLKVVKDPEEVNQLFLKRVNRRVNNDATISPAGRLFEVSPAFTGQRIEVAMNRVIWMRY